MKALDPHLLGESPAARFWIVVVVGAGTGGGAFAIATAWVLSRVLAEAVQQRSGLAAVMPLLVLVAGLVLARGAAAWVAEGAGHAAAREVIAGLRVRLLDALAGGGPFLVSDRQSGAIAVAATTGVDALDVYFARYLPQLVLGTVVPIMVLIFLTVNDLISALIVALTLPLIPIFMWLIGAAAQNRIDRRWALLQHLATYFLDVIQGLPTLRIFGRAEAQVDQVRAMTEATRRATMGTLSIAFLSSMVLETLASIATALVAAAIGLRLVYGTMTLQTGLAVLIVVPEAYLPLRQLGTFFHSSKEGLTAAGTLVDLIERRWPPLDPEPVMSAGSLQDGSSLGRSGDAATGSRNTPRAARNGRMETADEVRQRQLRSSRLHTIGGLEAGAILHLPPAPGTIAFTDVTYIYGDRGEGLVTPLTLCLHPGTTTVICGASGAGKTTLLSLLVPFMPCTGGAIQVDGVDLCDLDIGTWRRQVGWLPQRPALFSGSVLDNIRLGAPDSSEAEVAHLLTRLFPDGALAPATTLTADGEGLSGGERTRLALARALVRSPSLLLLDEPTSFLDPQAASAVLALLVEYDGSTTMVIATHEPERFPWAHEIVTLSSPPEAVSVPRRLDVGVPAERSS